MKIENAKKLICSYCQHPLFIILPEESDKKFYLGCLNCNQTPIVSHENLNLVIKKYYEKELKMNSKNSISRNLILKNIEHHLKLIDQWVQGAITNYGHAQKYQNKAEALIELLEVHDCGQVGGFDRGQPHSHELNLMDRYNWLKNKKDEK